LATVSDAILHTSPDSGPRPIAIPNDRSREDRIYRLVARLAGGFSFVILLLIGIFLFLRGFPALEGRGLKYFTTSGFQYRGAHPQYGVLAPMVGTLEVALIAVLVGVPLALGIALFLTEYAPIRLRQALVALVDVGAAIPSIVYGVWGYEDFEPQIQGMCAWMQRHLSFIPFFKASNPPYSASFFIAGLIVGLMIVPIVASVTREVFSLAPPGEREGALALGATKAQMIRTVVLPFGRGGLIGASMLGLGRALGETIAVLLILGGSFVVSDHILEHGGNTVASMIANFFGSGGKLATSELLMAGFVLFAFTLMVNLAASAVVNRSRSGKGVEL
jgi:phosphate transport system permease protein